VFAVATTYLTAVPGAGVNLFMVMPLYGASAVGVLALGNLALMAAEVAGARIFIDGAGHLGGMAVGWLAAQAWTRSEAYKKQVRRMYWRS
jgi:membrane associated rhomboid family serine protease